MRIQRGFTKYAEGSVLIEAGDTRVLCNASVLEQVPPFLLGTGRGWVTAEYSMLPRSTHTRTARERGAGGGRTQEIQRLIGRSLRAAVHMEKLGPRTIQLDCDVLQADGGTRTASITGAMVALCDAVTWLREHGMVAESPIADMVAAVSVGVLDGVPVLDLDYAEDARAEVDFNVVMLGSGGFVEVQGTAERGAFPRPTLDRLLDVAARGIAALRDLQDQALRTARHV